MSAGGIRPARTFQDAARDTLSNPQMRRNLRHATTTIREKRLRAVDELPDWEALRDEGAAIKDHVMANLSEYLLELEASVKARGGTCTGHATRRKPGNSSHKSPGPTGPAKSSKSSPSPLTRLS
ncbi:hypothetical protein ACFSC4_29560 [Deinococcus malanensis]|uniref:hypothetical protein n=1 Tax=Deinococcus malanensis TaxID=1706855 RepID=UPI00363B3938